MGFWDGETCEHCDGEIVDRRVTVHRRVDGHYVIVEDVPAGVCLACGMRYFSASVLKSIELTVRDRLNAKREEVVPVYSLAS